MTALILIQVALSLLALAAHFLRGAGGVLVGVCLACALLLLLVRQRWVLRLVQLLLILGTLEWLRSIFLLVGDRAARGQPWTRMMIILAAVTLFTALSAALLQSARMRRLYRPTGVVAGGDTSAAAG